MGELKKPDLDKPGFKLPIGERAMVRIKADKCATCGKDIAYDDFRDALSRKEYGISGMCQSCQDSVFG